MMDFGGDFGRAPVILHYQPATDVILNGEDARIESAHIVTHVICSPLGLHSTSCPHHGGRYFKENRADYRLLPGGPRCEEYARQGCIVYATARNPSSVKFVSADIHILKLDVVDDEQVKSVVKTVIKNEGKIDILVNNAGMGCAGPLVDTPVDVIQNVFNANTFSVMRMVQAVFPHMAARKSGEVVNVGSISGELPLAWNGVYSSSKAAMRSLSDVLWMEFKPFNISVTHISAGSVHSNLAKKALGTSLCMSEDSFYKAYTEQIIKRILHGKPPDSLPADEFARQVVTATLLPNPPRYMTLGKSSTYFWLLSWLPREWALNHMWNIVQKLGVSESPSPSASKQNGHAEISS
ncbi:hypothetical protein NM688_g2545 [Phlebia brevispora]|uniref:Uncharacterized protein n=1 Tax=Phlebia brevispora TaxID=194682 RepID=A0ACC1T8D8_9APHY|nr:hypothetical protein NM688_g2545 [Phlebia brevispora]